MGVLYNVWELCVMNGSFRRGWRRCASYIVWELCIMYGSFVLCVGVSTFGRSDPLPTTSRLHSVFFTFGEERGKMREGQVDMILIKEIKEALQYWSSE